MRSGASAGHNNDRAGSSASAAAEVERSEFDYRRAMFARPCRWPGIPGATGAIAVVEEGTVPEAERRQLSAAIDVAKAQLEAYAPNCRQKPIPPKPPSSPLTKN